MTSFAIIPDWTAKHAETIAAWNDQHPVGASVLYAISDYEPVNRKGLTTGPAFMLHNQIGGACVRVNTFTFPIHLDRIEVLPLPHLWAEDFPVSYQRRIILAYPQIAGLSNDEAWLARPEDKLAAFDRILAATNLRRTHEQYLETR
jgi:hypothetical protein